MGMLKMSFNKILHSATGVIFIALGIALLAGWVKFKTSSGSGMETVFGAIMILFGVFRLMVFKSRSSKRFPMQILLMGLAISLGVSACNKKKKEPEETVTSGKLTVVVSESHKRLFELEASEFMRYYEKARVEILGASTREAIVNLLNDSVKVAVTDRKLNPEEREVAQKAQMQIEEFTVAEDALVIVANRLNSIESLSMKNLGQILSGGLNRWDRLPQSRLSGPIALVLTGRNSGAYELLKNSFFQLDREFSLSALEDTQDGVLETVAKRPNAVGFVSFACYKDSASGSAAARFLSELKPLSISGVDSITGESARFNVNQYNIYLQRYPLHYTVYMIQNLKQSPLAKGFISFVSSTPGQKIFLNWGLVPKKAPIRLVQLTEEEIPQQ